MIEWPPLISNVSSLSVCSGSVAECGQIKRTAQFREERWSRETCPRDLVQKTPLGNTCSPQTLIPGRNSAAHLSGVSNEQRKVFPYDP